MKKMTNVFCYTLFALISMSEVHALVYLVQTVFKTGISAVNAFALLYGCLFTFFMLSMTAYNEIKELISESEEELEEEPEEEHHVNWLTPDE
jgi:hypothetical protein